MLCFLVVEFSVLPNAFKAVLLNLIRMIHPYDNA